MVYKINKYKVVFLMHGLQILSNNLKTFKGIRACFYAVVKKLYLHHDNQYKFRGAHFTKAI